MKRQNKFLAKGAKGAEGANKRLILFNPINSKRIQEARKY